MRSSPWPTSGNSTRSTARWSRCVPIVSEYTEDRLPDAPERTFAFDRVDWVNANIDSFERMFAPLEGLNLLGAAANQSIVGQMLGTLNQKVLSAEVGLTPRLPGAKVLGQYDLTLLGREPLGPGRLYYVEPNITAAERTLGLPREEFRMWLALHETTHAFNSRRILGCATTSTPCWSTTSGSCAKTRRICAPRGWVVSVFTSIGSAPEVASPGASWNH